MKVKYHMSCVIRKPAFYMLENKGEDYLHGNHTADQHLCFHYIHVDGTIPQLPKSKRSSL